MDGETPPEDALVLYGRRFRSRMMLGTAQYPSPAVLGRAIAEAGAEIVTVSLRREGAGPTGGGEAFWTLVRETGATVLPNTAGCRTAREAITTAQMARELFETAWIKLEVILDDDTLAPDVHGLVEAARVLAADGFEVFPYTTDDAGVADRLIDAGCRVLMPWAAPIGTARGVSDPYALRALRARHRDVPMVVDAGLGLPSHAATVMEMGFDAVLLNTAVARAADPVAMAGAFARAVEAGRRARLAGPMEPRDMAQPSTPVAGRAFWTE